MISDEEKYEDSLPIAESSKMVYRSDLSTATTSTTTTNHTTSYHTTSTTSTNHTTTNHATSTTTTHTMHRGTSKTTEKYSLRPRKIGRRLQELDRGRGNIKNSSSRVTKSRPPPLSKYRRKTANARERHRMKEINDAFETLRQILPDICSRRVEAESAMTKITTLKVAASYIKALSLILEDGRRPGNMSRLEDIHRGHTLPAIHDPQPSGAREGSANTQLFQNNNTKESQNSSLSSCFPSYSSTSSYSYSSSSSSSASPSYPPLSHLHCSFGSNSDLSDLLSDDSCCVLEDNLDLFDDIPPLPGADPFALLLTHDSPIQDQDMQA